MSEAANEQLVGMVVGGGLVLLAIWLATQPPRLPVAPAVFLGWQEGWSGPDFALYQLTDDIEGHPKGSTVSAMTLERLGYRLPRTPVRLSTKGGVA